MTHYAILRDYQFDADIQDIRGARLYGDGGSELARIDDVLFEHGSGNIEYLVANEGHGRRVLIPVSEVRTAITSDRDFDSDLTKTDMDHLPAFEEKILKHDEQWKHYIQLHREAIEERQEAAQREYKEAWTDDPVAHRSDNVAHTITPVGPVPPSNVTPIDRGRRNANGYVADLTPKRLAPIFTNTENTPDKLNMVPNVGHSRGPAADYVTAGLGPKWNGYQEMIRRELPMLRGTCETCRRNKKKVA